MTPQHRLICVVGIFAWSISNGSDGIVLTSQAPQGHCATVLKGLMRADSEFDSNDLEVIALTPNTVIAIDWRFSSQVLLDYRTAVILDTRSGQKISLLQFPSKPDETIDMPVILPAGTPVDLGTEVQYAGLKFAFEVLKVKRVIARTTSDDSISIRIQKVLGFRQIGPDGDVLRFELFRENFTTSQFSEEIRDPEVKRF